jgi:hypothetical protein
MPAEAANVFESQVIAHLRPLRGQAVILDSDLAWFLGIELERIAEAIENRPALFPPDFVFHLTTAELSQFEKASPCLTAGGTAVGGKRVAFCTHGIGMLLLAFPEERFSLAAIPVLRAIASYWKAEETVLTTKPLVNRNS